MAATGSQLRDKQWQWLILTGKMRNYTQVSEHISLVLVFIVLFHSINVLTSSYPTNCVTCSCEGTRECQVAWHLSALYCSSLSPSVSHSGKSWLCSQDAQLPHGEFIYSQMTQMSHIGTLQDPQLETPLPSCPTTGDAVAMETGLFWHHSIWSDLPWRPNPRYAHDPTSLGLVRHY